MTQLSSAKEGTITEEMKTVAKDEQVTPEFVRQEIEKGKIIIPKNMNHKFSPRGIGYGLNTKVNANIGTSPSHYDIDEELCNLNASLYAETDSVMDLSTGGDLDLIRKTILENS